MTVTDCAFQDDAYQNDAFQVCTPVVVQAGGRYPVRRGQIVYDDDEDALIIALMETLLND